MKIDDFSEYKIILKNAPPFLILQSRSNPRDFVQVPLSQARHALLYRLCEQRVVDGDGIAMGWVAKDALSITKEMEALLAAGKISEECFRLAVKERWHRDYFADNIYKTKQYLSRHGIGTGFFESIRGFIRLSDQIGPDQIHLDMKKRCGT